jgi:hypothetical protein
MADRAPYQAWKALQLHMQTVSLLPIQGQAERQTHAGHRQLTGVAGTQLDSAGAAPA